ncbi:MAG: sugar phosphate isomerase/epimerase [Planctomycetota bacterium]|nr:MAG: sugar phosphate isomerase/epimerase [Planctomycetota bacterium]
MLPGYNTNGFAHHKIEDALQILAELGYRSIAFTLDYNTVEPFAANAIARARELGKMAQDLGLNLVIETGARFLLDPRRKHQPTLLSKQASDRKKRADFLLRCAELGLAMGSNTLSFWSGKPDFEAAEDSYWQLLIEQCIEISKQVENSGMKIAFEPEPGMFIDTMSKFEELHKAISHSKFGLTLDIGHLECMNEMPLLPHLEKWSSVLWNIHLEDMRQGVHDHLPPGEGLIDFGKVFEGLNKIKYEGGVHWELSRHSHDAVETARKCRQFMQKQGC